MSAKYRSPSFLLPNELNTSANTANDTGINSLYSMDFNGSSNTYVDLGIITEINGLSNFSFSVWIKPVSPLGGAQGIVFGNRDINNSYEGIAFALHGPSLTGTSYVYLEGNLLPIPTGTFTFNQWSHVIITYDNATFAIYVDNSLINSVSLANQSLTSTAAFNIGRDVAIGAAKDFNGQIDEFAIFNRALDSTERAALYGGTSPNIYPSNLMATNLNPLAYYPLGEQAQNSGYPSATGNEWQFPNGVLQDYVMDFDGSTDYIDAGSSVGAIGTGVRTFSVWLKTSNNGVNTVLGTRDVNIDGWVIQIEGTIYGTPSILFYNTKSPSARIQTSLNVNDGNWHHIVIVRAGSGNNKIYVDGVSQTLSNSSENLTDPQSSKNLLISAGYNTGGTLFRYFDGEMSNLAIWNSDQSANIADIYNNGSPQTSYTVTPQNWWKLNATSVYTPSVASYSTALDFGGTDYIDCGVVSAVENVSSFSMSVWVYPTNGSLKSVIGNWGNPYVGVEIGTSSGAVYFTVDSDTGGSGYGATPSGLSNSNWAHLVLVFDGSGSGDSGRLKGYINGVEQTLSYTGTIPATTAAPNRAFRIGDQHVGNGLIGNISNAAIFNSALTSTQVSTLFNFGTPETAISFSPTSWWKLDNLITGLLDSGSASNNGTNNGTAQVNTSVAVVPSWKIPSALPITTTPNYTTALDFNADHIDFGNSIGNLIGDNYTGGFTVSFWINPTTTGNDDGIFTFPGTGGISFVVRQNDFRLYNNGEKFSFDYGTNSNKEWSHCVLSFLPSGSVFYVNSIPVKNWTYTDLDLNGKNLEVGWYANSNTYSFIGQLSNFQIWNTNLSNTEASTLYNNGTPVAALSGIPQSSNLISWWKLDTGGSTITDSAGSNNGTNSTPGATQVTSDVLTSQPVNGVSTTLPSTALQQSDLQFDSPYSNYSLYLDGTSTVTISDLQSSFTNLSISFWIKSGVDATNAYVFARGTSQFLIFQNLTNASLKYRVKTDAGATSYTAIGGNILDNNWHHCVMVVDTSNNFIKVYEDGSEIATTTTVGNIETSTSIAYLASASNGVPFKSGNFDELSMFDSVLTSAQVLEIYNNGRPKDLTTFSGTAPISWWRLGENAYFQDSTLVLPNSITGAPNGNAATNNLEMLSADAPGTYANGIGTNLDILDRVGDAALSTSNSQSYNMIPSDISPYVPEYVGNQIANNFSMTFDGVDDYFNAGNDSSLNIIGSLSVSAWFKTLNNTSSIMIVTKDDGASNRAWQLYMISTGSIRFAINGVTAFATSSGVYDDGNWHHVLALYEPSNYVKLYIDGVADGEDTTSVPASINNLPSQDVVIGAYSVYDGGTRWNGQIDEVAIFNYALNAGQIYNDIYLPTKSGTGLTANLDNNPNLTAPVAWYRMGD